MSNCSFICCVYLAFVIKSTCVFVRSALLTIHFYDYFINIRVIISHFFYDYPSFNFLPMFHLIGCLFVFVCVCLCVCRIINGYRNSISITHYNQLPPKCRKICRLSVEPNESGHMFKERNTFRFCICLWFVFFFLFLFHVYVFVVVVCDHVCACCCWCCFSMCQLNFVFFFFVL